VQDARKTHVAERLINYACKLLFQRWFGLYVIDAANLLVGMLLMEIRQEIMENPLRRKEIMENPCLVPVSNKRIKTVKTLNAKSFALRPYGVLGTRRGLAGIRQAAPGPTANLCAFCDPAGLLFFKEYGPRHAGGASGSIYAWLGISEQGTFPSDVVNAIVKETDDKAFVCPRQGSGHLHPCSGAPTQ
jgi:hypothetical protein